MREPGRNWPPHPLLPGIGMSGSARPNCRDSDSSYNHSSILSGSARAPSISAATSPIIIPQMIKIAPLIMLLTNILVNNKRLLRCICFLKCILQKNQNSWQPSSEIAEEYAGECYCHAEENWNHDASSALAIASRSMS